jgi:hypothetical protein
MTASKTALTATSLAFAMIFGGGVYLYMNLGSIAQQIAQRLASETLGVTVTMSKLDVSLQERMAVVHNLRIGNPDGYKGKDAMTISKISIALGNVSKELITFKDISVDKTHVYLQVTPQGTNLSTIKNQIKTLPAQAPAADVQPLKVILSRTGLMSAQLHPTVTLLSEEALAAVTIPDIILTGIGEKENGILAREAIAQVWNGIMPHVEKAASEAGFYEGLSPDALKDMGVGKIEGLRENFKKDLDEGLGGVLKNPFSGD